MRFERALGALAAANEPLARRERQTDAFHAAAPLLADEGGLRALWAQAHRFDAAGVFAGGPWADPRRLQPPLVLGGLLGAGVHPVLETLSELRMLALALGRADGAVGAGDARAFLNEVLALNLELVFPRATEEERRAASPERAAAVRLFALLLRELRPASLRREVVSEIEQIAAQRPVVTSRLRRLIELAERIPPDPGRPEVERRLASYQEALAGPGPLGRAHPTLAAYREALAGCDSRELEVEARACAASLRTTGLASPLHAALVRVLRARAPRLLGTALALDPQGELELGRSGELVHELVRLAVRPATAQCLYGLARVLEAGLLVRREVLAGLRRLMRVKLRPEVKRVLLAEHRAPDGAPANAVLVAGVLAVLGQPLGIGQGRNPTCQSARGISLWAQHAQGYLLELLVSAARDGFVAIAFEGELLRSDALAGGLAGALDPALDPVSLVLIPHLDRIYDAMMQRVASRPDDGHRWVNPALYGRWVPGGFASVFQDLAQTTVAAFPAFARRFFATHHPAYNHGYALRYPTPVGLVVTTGSGDYLGPHAVSLQRIEAAPDGALRVYFFNPNDEGRQDWGRGVRPSIRGHGERPGESSLPFAQLAARLYAFHYDEAEVGELDAVPRALVGEVERAARESWGRAFRWES